MAEIISAFPTSIAMGDNGVQRFAEATVYAATDDELTTPLAITDLQGIPLTDGKLTTTTGQFPQFKGPPGVVQVLVVSGGRKTLLTDLSVYAGASAESATAAAGAAGTAAAAATTAAGAATTATKAAQDAVAAGTTTDTITSRLLRDEQSATHAETTGLILEIGGSGRFEIVEDPANPGFGIIVPVGATPAPAQDIAPVILTTSLPALTVGVPVSAQIAATGEPSAMFVSEGALPAGVAMSSEGLILGTPTSAGSYSFTVTATNAVEADTQVFAGSVAASGTAPVITGPQSVTLTQGVPASAQLKASGSGPITYAVTGGTIPAGLTLSSAGVLSGTPTGSGPFTVQITATNPFGSNAVTFSGSVAASSTPVNTTPGGSAGVTTAYGANGTHWPSRTARPSSTFDSTVEVNCDWTSISQAIQTAQARFPGGNCQVLVRPGTLGGNGAGSTSTPVLQNIGGEGRATRILVRPRDGAFSIKHTASARLHNIAGVSFVGFCPWGLGVAENASFGILLTNCKDTAWAWSKTRFMNITSSAGESNGVEFVECVAPLQGARDDDRSAFRNGDGGNTRNVLIDGCYLAGTYKADGSSAHCDTLQLSGPGVFENIDFRDSAMFGSTNATYITTGATTGKLKHTALIGGFRTALRYPVGADRSQFINGPVAFNGAPADYAASDGTLLVGKVVPVFSSVANSKTAVAAPTPKSGAWTLDAGLFDTAAKIDAEIPFPTDARLQSIWAL